MKYTIFLSLLLTVPALGQPNKDHKPESNIPNFITKYVPKTIAGSVTGAAIAVAHFECEKLLNPSCAIPEKLILWFIFHLMRNRLSKKINEEVFEMHDESEPSLHNIHQDSLVSMTAQLSDWITYGYLHLFCTI